MKVVNPANGDVVRTYSAATWEEAAARIEALDDRFRRWRRTPIVERARLLGAAAPLLRESAPRFARMMAVEMGKPMAQGRQEIEKCAWLCEHYASAGPAMLEPQPVATEARSSWVSFQ